MTIKNDGITIKQTLSNTSISISPETVRFDMGEEYTYLRIHDGRLMTFSDEDGNEPKYPQIIEYDVIWNAIKDNPDVRLWLFDRGFDVRILPSGIINAGVADTLGARLGIPTGNLTLIRREDDTYKVVWGGNVGSYKPNESCNVKWERKFEEE